MATQYYDVLDAENPLKKQPIQPDTSQLSNRYKELRDSIMSGSGTLDTVSEMESLNRQANQMRGQGDVVTATTDLSQLRAMIEGRQPTATAQAIQQPQQMQQPQQPQSYVQPVRDNTNMIQNAYNSQLQSIVSQIKSAIAQSKQGYNNIIQDAPKQFQGAKNQAEVNRMRGLNTLQEVIANRGDRGGVGRSEMLQTDIAGQNNLNNIEAQQNQVITDAQRAIANLEEQGRFAEAQAVQENAYRMLQDMIDESRRIDDMNLNIAQMLGSYNGQRTLAGQHLDRGIFESNRNFDRSVLESDRAYNYQQEMNRLAREDQQREIEWQRSINNPQYKAQLLQNEINEIKIANLPTEIKQEADQIALALAQGQINLDIAKEQLRQLKQKPVSGGSTSTPKGGYSLEW
jgi:hypothetical protein